MRISHKPVRKCHACVLNLGDHCWLHPLPHEQWRNGKTCHAKEDEKIHREFKAWQKQPSVKTRSEIRRELFRARTEPHVARRQKKGRTARE